MATPAPAPKSDSGVAELQRVLKAYAQITGNAAVDPGTVDGLVGPKTAMAVMVVLPQIPGLPSEVTALIPVMQMLLATDDGRTRVYDIIRKNASRITVGVIALEAYRAGSAAVGAGQTPSPGTPTRGSGLRLPDILAISTANVSAPATPTGVPTQPQLSIWYWDGAMFRIAVPRQNVLAGFVDYVEVASSASQPTMGTQVSRTEFMKAIGKWYATPVGIGGLAAGAVAVVGLTFLGVKALSA